MNEARERSLGRPELVLVMCFVVIFTLFVWGSSLPACHAWRDKLINVASALLTNNSLPTPLPESAGEREELRRRAREILRDRPLGCL